MPKIPAPVVKREPFIKHLYRITPPEGYYFAHFSAGHYGLEVTLASIKGDKKWLKKRNAEIVRERERRKGKK
jgi:hypothetical protein